MKNHGQMLVAGGLLLLIGAAVAGLTLGLPGSPRSAAPTRLARFHAQQVPAARGPDILLITIDALRADHVGLYGYQRPTTPAIDAFFSAGRVFDVAYAPTATTTPSIVSLLTGLYPQRHGVRLLCQRLADDVITIVDHLRRVGYQTVGIVSNAVLADAASGLGERFDYYDDRVDEAEPFRDEMFERKASRTTDAAIAWLTEHRASDRPHFLWVHYIDPHGPYRPPADKPVDFDHAEPMTIDPLRVPKYSREPGVTDGRDYIDRYDEEIAYTDREVRRLLNAYRGLGLLESAAVILTSDHGESMMEHEHWFQHQMNVYEEMVRVPLAVRYPTLEPMRVTTPVSLVDLAPTILELAALPLPPDLEGISLLGSIPARAIHCEGRAKGGGLWRGLVEHRTKTAVRHGMSNIIREGRVYDLSADPLELQPMPLDHHGKTYRILDQLVRRDPDPGGVPTEYAEGTLPAPNVAPTIDERTRSQLRSLGYVGG